MVFKIPLVFLVFLVVNSQALASVQSPTDFLHLDTFERLVPTFDAPISSPDAEEGNIIPANRNF